jgi:hypothetical protein
MENLEKARGEQRWVLADLKRVIDDFSRPWHPPVKKPRKQAHPPKAERPGRQSNFPRPAQAEFFGIWGSPA